MVGGDFCQPQRNSTLSNNTALQTGGGALWNWGTLRVENSTFSDNTAPTGGGLLDAGQSMTVRNSILANSSATTDCFTSSGAFTGSNNLIETDSSGANACGIANSIVGRDPALAPLANNGGNTRTQIPAVSSPVIDAGSNACLSHDQRGITRPQNGTCDIGAVEIEAVCKDVAVVAGWNLVSMPVTLSDMTVATNFPHATSSAFGYGNGYNVATALTTGKGYWLKFDQPRTYNFCGFPNTETRIPVTAGWNMIAPYHNALTTSGLSTVNTMSNQITTSFFHYSSGYGVATALQPGGGYWVKVDADGFLQWSSARTAQDVPTASSCPMSASLSITTTDGTYTNALLLGTSANGTDGIDAACGEFELPPAAPAGLESRFVVPSGEQVWTDIRGNSSQQWELRLDNVATPATFTWDGVNLNGRVATIHYFSGGQVVSAELSANGSRTLPDDVTTVTITIASTPTAVTLRNVTAMATQNTLLLLLSFAGLLLATIIAQYKKCIMTPLKKGRQNEVK